MDNFSDLFTCSLKLFHLMETVLKIWDNPLTSVFSLPEEPLEMLILEVRMTCLRLFWKASKLSVSTVIVEISNHRDSNHDSDMTQVIFFYGLCAFSNKFTLRCI